MKAQRSLLSVNIDREEVDSDFSWGNGKPTNPPKTPRPTVWKAPPTPRPSNPPKTPKPTNPPRTPRPTAWVAPKTPKPTNPPKTPKPSNPPVVKTLRPTGTPRPTP